MMPISSLHPSIKMGLLIAVASLFAFALEVSGESPATHQRLLFRNRFKNPKEVVHYYCERDASGFVWSGLLESERKNFTLWTKAPDVDSFLIAKDYRIMSEEIEPGEKEATVRVKYELLGVGDGHGAFQPPPGETYFVNFRLKKEGNTWKIYQPFAHSVSAVVLESRFPYKKPDLGTRTGALMRRPDPK